MKNRIDKAGFELLAPAKNKDTAQKAILSGADAVYAGYLKFGARAAAGNSTDDLIQMIEFAHLYRAKVYIAFNTILDDEEIKQAEKLINKFYEIKADGLIIQDMGILELDLPPVPLIASTQCHNNTIEKIQFLEKTGFKRVILPRETSLEEIKKIKQNTGNIELECFIHGALCVSYSGQCYMSYVNGGRSANRGECAQACRKKYSLKDADGKFIAKDKQLLSLKDLNLSEHLEALMNAGITSFKIEGRLKNEAYVINTTAYYRRAIDKALNNLTPPPDPLPQGEGEDFQCTPSPIEGKGLLTAHCGSIDKTPSPLAGEGRGEGYGCNEKGTKPLEGLCRSKSSGEAFAERRDGGRLERASLGISSIDFTPDLNKTFNRGFTGFNFKGYTKNIAAIDYSGSLGEFAGIVKTAAADYFVLDTDIKMNNADGICFFNENKELTGVNVNKTQGNKIYPASMKGIKKGVKIYRNFDKAFDDKLKNSKLIRQMNAFIKIAEINTGYWFFLSDEEENTAVYGINRNIEAARNKDAALNTLRTQLEKSGGTEFKIKVENINLNTVPYIKASVINEIRRILIDKLRRIRSKNYPYENRLFNNIIVPYPIKELDYRANIYNKKAEEFYVKRGAIVKEYALESGISAENRAVMTSKYCIKNQLGICSKKGVKCREPLILIDEYKKEYKLNFDCGKCIMTIT